MLTKEQIQEAETTAGEMEIVAETNGAHGVTRPTKVQGAAFYELRAAMRCDDAAVHCRNGKRFLAREALREAIEFLNEAEIED